MPTFITTQTDLLDSVNYLLAGPQTLGQSSQGYWNFAGGWFIWDNTLPPYITAATNTPPVSLASPITAGTFFRSPAYVFVNTTSATDSILVTSQLRPFIIVDGASVAPWSFYLSIDVYRYLVDEQQPGSYVWGEKFVNYELIAQDNNYFTDADDPAILAGTASIGETVFCSIVDRPGVGRWCYSMELNYSPETGTPILNYVYGENIGITATVIKI